MNVEFRNTFGAFIGPCAHGHKEFARCEVCGDLSNIAAELLALRRLYALAERELEARATVAEAMVAKGRILRAERDDLRARVDELDRHCASLSAKADSAQQDAAEQRERVEALARLARECESSLHVLGHPEAAAEVRAKLDTALTAPRRPFTSVTLDPEDCAEGPDDASTNGCGGEACDHLAPRLTSGGRTLCEECGEDVTP